MDASLGRLVVRRDLPWIILAPAGMAALYAWAVFASTFVHPGLIGPNYNAPGSDWMVMYAAARASLSGHLALIFDGDRFTAHLNALFAGWLTEPLDFRPWVYPPSFLLMLAPFAPLGFFGSYAAFQIVSGGLLVAALRYRADRGPAAAWIALAALASPAAAVNAVDGQCGFLVAALLVGGFRLVRVRPLAAGVLVGLLTFKPQFGLMVPIALIAMRQWRCLLAAALTVLALVAASAAAFGADAWFAWGREAVQGYLGRRSEMGDLRPAVGRQRLCLRGAPGAPAMLASIIQTATILASAAATYAAFRSRLRPDLKLAVLLTAALLAAPHSANYDDVLLVIAAGLWLAAQPRPWPPWQGIMALALWLSALVSPPVLSPPGRLTPLLLAVFIALVLGGVAGKRDDPAAEEAATTPAGTA